jgi:hypothetical protein
LRPLPDLEIMSRKHALEIFRGTLPPQGSACKDDYLSALSASLVTPAFPSAALS